MSRAGIRNTSISSDPKMAARQTAENARDANSAMLGKVSGYIQQVFRYAAIGATTARIQLEWLGTRRPVAVLLVSAQLTNDPGTDITISPRFNFYHDHVGLGVYEPLGLTANAQYDLTFLILE